MNYFDSSALVKRFVAEKGSSLVNRLLAPQQLAATATITYAEVHAALARKRRDGGLPLPQYERVCRQFDSDWQGYVRVELRDDILMLARDLIRRHPLRGFDAIHLASAVSLQTGLGEPVTFIVADERLLLAAQAEQLGFLSPERPE